MCERCEAVFHARRYLGVCLAAYEAVALERAQHGREHFLRYVGNVALELLEPHRCAVAFVEREQYEQGPFAAYSGKDIAYRAVREKLVANAVLRVRFVHAGMLVFFYG